MYRYQHADYPQFPLAIKVALHQTSYRHDQGPGSVSVFCNQNIAGEMYKRLLPGREKLDTTDIER